MWAFVLFESLVFTSYFMVYLYSRTQHADLFLHAQSQLHLPIGVLNTIVLLTSSWFAARCVQASRNGESRSALIYVSVAAGLGVVFLITKVLEWAGQIRQGNTFTTNEFFQHYFFLTSIHCLHLLIGFVALGVAARQLRRRERRSQQLIETVATYWHTVDFLWVLIFALLYVVR
ncbi:cytochrome c oxidase subunit 3 [Nocardia wallacei]|uniref:cytochrome c oxidase subunit 3 n=2 Tax=Bacteria TaxID=2 RepID=UPI0024565BD4|nr:cytochrome c oxidase subunit 3 [Nocardia wallacei]